MEKVVNQPTNKEVTSFIQQVSPEKSKCIEADYVNLVGMGVLAWVVDASLSKEQGYYIAYCSKYQQGKFSQVKSTEPCRYYDVEGKRIITSSPFIHETDSKKPLISVCESSPKEAAVLVTLSCKGKPFSQVFMKNRD